MKKIIVLLAALGAIGCDREAADGAPVAASARDTVAEPELLHSPDRKLKVAVYVTAENTLAYKVIRAGQPVVLESELGLQLNAADFTRDVRFKESSSVKSIEDEYTMRVGKKSRIVYRANERTFRVLDAQGRELAVIFRVSNDGVAFRYVFDDPSVPEKKFIRETTGFRFPETARAWLQPVAPARTGWSQTNPSYEEYYQMDVPVGTPSTMGAGWVFPALFSINGTLALLSEAGMDGSWHGSRLHHESPLGAYRLDVPQAPEVFTGGALLANSADRLVSPWRILAIGNLDTIMESTLGTDLVDPAIETAGDFIKPGHASWSWALLKDDHTVFDEQKRFIDYAADMHWDYTLVDADWDRKIGYDKLKELVDYGASKNVSILVWFNSSGDWNETVMTPKSELLTREQRAAVFSRLRDMGVKGIKVDFFAGDGQSMIAYYLDILKDAAQHQLLVNFHGATLPRGWQRTWPNLMTMEAVRGFEFGTFDQKDQDPIAAHAVMSLFTRNVFDPMDFTPMVFGDIPRIKRVTENSFELAQAVLMISGIQHFAEIPEGMATAPDYVKEFLRELPREWDDVKFMDGFPGRYVAIARRAGDVWYVAGLNAERQHRIFNLDLDFTDADEGFLIGGGDTARSFSSSRHRIGGREPLRIEVRPSAGFVMVLK